MVGPIIKSVLKAGIDKLPDVDIAAQSLPNMLRKKGVKDEELKFSGVELPTKGSVSPEELATLEAGRKDTFGSVDAGTTHKQFSIKALKDNPGYRENVYTFKQEGQAGMATPDADEVNGLFVRLDSYGDDEAFDAVTEDMATEMGWGGQSSIDEWLSTLPIGSKDSRYTSSHMQQVPNYLMHTRTGPGTVGGKNTHIVQEIQSDLHQAGRQYGYRQEQVVTQAELVEIVKLNSGTQEARVEAQQLARHYGYTDDTMPLHQWTFTQQELLEGAQATIPESPYKNSWLSKGIEREVAVAIDEGFEQIAIPIKGAVQNLKRGTGVQKWYEDKVLGATKKIARANDMDFKIVREGGSEAVDHTKDSTVIMNVWRKGKGSAETISNLEQTFPHLEYSTIKDVATADSVGFANSIIEAAVVKATRRDMVKTIADNMRAGAELGEAPTVTIDRLRELYPEVRRADMHRIDRVTHAEGERILDQAGVGADDAIEYAVITPKAGVRPEFSLYSVEMSGVLMAYEASKFGYSEEEVTAELVKKGYEEEEAKQAAKQAKQAVDAGFTKEQIQEHLTKQEPQFESRQAEPVGEPELPDEDTTVGDTYRKLFGAEEYSPEEFMAMMQVIAPDSSFITTNISGWLGNQESQRISDKAAKVASDKLVAMMKSRGLETRVNPESGNFEAFDEQQQSWAPLSAGIWDSVWANKYEAVGATAGALLGARIGASAGAVAGSLMPVVGTTIGGIGSGLIGAVIGGYQGALAGSELDYMHNSVLLAEDLNAEVMARKVFTVAELEAVAGVLGTAGFKLVGKAWNSIASAKEAIKSGEFSRASKALQEQLFVDSDTADELVAKMAKVANVPGKNRSEQQIAAAAMTRPGAEGLVKAGAAIDPTASAAVRHSIDARAKDLLAAADEIGDKDIGRLLRNELEAFTTTVKDNYARVKAIPAQAPRAGSFRFKYDNLMLEPALARLTHNIDDPILASRFLKQATRIRDMSSTRSFADLIELRSLVNDFKFNKRISSTKDFNMLNDVLTRIDNSINTAAHVTLDKPKEWLKEFTDAKASYKQMKDLENNVIAKLVGRKGVSEDTIAKSLTKYAFAVDDTFVEAMAAMPKSTRDKVEGAVMDHLSNLYTTGSEGGMRATHFPMLAAKLEEVTFSSPDARAMKKAINELAEVFRNDIPLAQVSGDIQIPKFQSFLTVDPVVRAQFEIATGVFNTIKTWAPGKKNRALALVKKTASVLENPVHSKSIKELVEMLDGEINIQPQLEQLAIAAAKRKAATGAAGMPKVRLYGDRSVLTTKGNGAQQSIPLHRIASTAEIKRISEATGINMADRKALDHALKERGYSAVQLGTDSVRKLK